MSKRDRQIRDPFEQNDRPEPIQRPDGTKYQEVEWTFAADQDDLEPKPLPVVDQPVADKLGNFEIQDVHAGADIVGDAIGRDAGGFAQPDADGDGYYTITMTNVDGEEEDGDSPLNAYLD